MLSKPNLPLNFRLDLAQSIQEVYARHNLRGELRINHADGSNQWLWVGEGPPQPEDVYTLVDLKIGEPHA